MTFEEIINHQNKVNPNAQYHVFGEYNDGHRGIFMSLPTLHAARVYVGRICDGIIYDRNGEEVV